MKKHNGKLEVMFCLLIFLDLAIMLIFSDNKYMKMVELSNQYEYATIIDENRANELTSLIKPYRPGKYKMYEHYDENLNLIYRYNFLDLDGEIGDFEEIDDDDHITAHKKLTNFLYENEEGRTHYKLQSDEEENLYQSVYFKWVEDANGKRYLNIIYTYRYILSNEGIFYLDICVYIAIALVFSVVVILIQRNHMDKIRFYSELTRIQSSIDTFNK